MCHTIRNDKFPRTAVKVSMTDEYVVRRLHEVTGLGTFGPAWRKEGNKPIWSWQVNQDKAILPLVVLLLPHLGLRRQEAAWKVIEAIGNRMELRAQSGEICPNGHPREGNSREVIRKGRATGCLYCVLCRKDANVRAHAKRANQGVSS